MHPTTARYLVAYQHHDREAEAAKRRHAAQCGIALSPQPVARRRRRILVLPGFGGLLGSMGRLGRMRV